MARWKQVTDEDGKNRLVPVDQAAAARDSKTLSIIRGNFDAFRSPVDGSIIATHRDLENHNKRNSVVNSAEFSPEFLESKRKERERILRGEHTREEKFERKREIYNRWVEAERNG